MLRWRNVTLMLGLCVCGVATRGFGYLYNSGADAAKAIAVAEAWAAKHPKEARGYYILGRLHVMVWAYGDKIDLSSVGGGDEPPSFVPWDTIALTRKGENIVVPLAPMGGMVAKAEKAGLTEEDGKHLASAINFYREAVRVEPQNALYQVGLAWVLDRAAENARALPEVAQESKEKPADGELAIVDAALRRLGDADAKVREEATKAIERVMPRCIKVLQQFKTEDLEVTARIARVLRNYWEEEALQHYRKAFELTVDRDLAAKDLGPDPEEGVSLLAGMRIQRLLENHAEDEIGERDGVNAAVDKLSKLPWRPRFY